MENFIKTVQVRIPMKTAACPTQTSHVKLGNWGVRWPNDPETAQLIHTE